VQARAGVINNIAESSKPSLQVLQCMKPVGLTVVIARDWGRFAYCNSRSKLCSMSETGDQYEHREPQALSRDTV